MTPETHADWGRFSHAVKHRTCGTWLTVVDTDGHVNALECSICEEMWVGTLAFHAIETSADELAEMEENLSA